MTALDIACVRVLGPVQAVTTAGHAVDLASASQRRLVAILAAEAPRSVRADVRRPNQPDAASAC